MEEPNAKRLKGEDIVSAESGAGANESSPALSAAGSSKDVALDDDKQKE